MLRSLVLGRGSVGLVLALKEGFEVLNGLKAGVPRISSEETRESNICSGTRS